MIPVSHLLLAAGWMLYCFLHSLLAAPVVKQYFERCTGRYYRFYYSLFAFLTLLPLVWFQFSLPSRLLFDPVYWLLPFLFVGLVLMFVSIKKYFLYLSGIDIFLKRNIEERLQVNGLHSIARHPLYLGTLLVLWSLLACFPYLSHLVTISIITLYTIVGAKFEEKKLRKQYGVEYSNYAEHVSMIIPFKYFSKLFFKKFQADR